MNPIRNPFSRDEYPALTDAINGVVNGQPRPVEDPITEDAMTAERDAELRGKMKREKDYGEYRKLRAQREKEAKSKKLYGKGGKIDTSRKPDVSKSKQIWEDTHLHELSDSAERAAAYRAGDRAPGDREREARQKARANAAAKSKSVKEDVQNADRWQEAETEKRRAHEDLARAKAAHKKKSSDATLRKIRKAEDRIRDIGYKHRDEHESPNIYGRGGKVVGRQWSRDDLASYHRECFSQFHEEQLDERLVGGADFVQAAKNAVTGKGFKTNREVSASRVNANMAAMQRDKKARKEYRDTIDDADHSMKNMTAAQRSALDRRYGPLKPQAGKKKG